MTASGKPTGKRAGKPAGEPARESAALGRVWRQITAGPRDALELGLSPADLQTLLLDVSRRRAAAVSPARLMRRWQQDRYVRPASHDPRRVSRFEARLWALLPAEFAGVELSPVAPLGVCAALAPVSQDRVISTVRGTEVVACCPRCGPFPMA